VNYGLGVNVNETTKEIVKKSVQAEQLGLHFVWVSDVPAQRYAFTVASAIAANTKKIQIGVGLLSTFLYTPEQVAGGFFTLVEAYGDRFELCIGPGDRDQLKRVGIPLFHPQGIPNFVLDSKKKIEKRLKENKVEGKVWLGAQGPKMLEIAKFFDGVLLNYASPVLIQWAMNKIGRVNKERFYLGVYAPSYIYSSLDNEVYALLHMASAVVALSAPKIVLKKLGMYQKIIAVKKKLEAGSNMKSVLAEIPSEVVDWFSIYKPAEKLDSYIFEVSRLGIEHIVFSYPQNYSEETIRELAHALL